MRRGIIPAAIVALALAVPATSSAWQLSGAKFFGINGTKAQDYKITIKKCSGPKLGLYKLRYDHFLLIQDPKDDLLVKLDMRVRFPITTQFKHTKVEKYDLTYSHAFPDEAADTIHDSLVPFYNGIKIKASSDAKDVRIVHGPLEIGGQEVIEAEDKTLPFAPKPGC